MCLVSIVSFIPRFMQHHDMEHMKENDPPAPPAGLVWNCMMFVHTLSKVKFWFSFLWLEAPSSLLVPQRFFLVTPQPQSLSVRVLLCF